jgi:hypothetical protein
VYGCACTCTYVMYVCMYIRIMYVCMYVLCTYYVCMYVCMYVRIMYVCNTFRLLTVITLAFRGKCADISHCYLTAKCRSIRSRRV